MATAPSTPRIQMLTFLLSVGSIVKHRQQKQWMKDLVNTIEWAHATREELASAQRHPPK